MDIAYVRKVKSQVTVQRDKLRDVKHALDERIQELNSFILALEKIITEYDVRTEAAREEN